MRPPRTAGGTNPLPHNANLTIFTTGHGGVDGSEYLHLCLGGIRTGQYITDTELIDTEHPDPGKQHHADHGEL